MTLVVGGPMRVPSNSGTMLVKTTLPAVGSPTTLPSFKRGRLVKSSPSEKVLRLVTSTVGASRRALTEADAAGHGAETAADHGEIIFAGEDVDRVAIDESAAVVADVHDDAGAGLVVGIKIGVEAREGGLGHIGEVDVTELSLAGAIDVFAAGIDPGAGGGPALGSTVHRGKCDFAGMPSALLLILTRDALADLLLQQFVEVRRWSNVSCRRWR